jgi:E3 ubiquitin-protein ligase MYLIP
VQSATHNSLCVILNTIQDDGSTATHSLKLANKSAANALYRDMTEMHSFYHCDTIGSLVTEQYCRDLKGTIISFFNENTCLGKRYVFDIQRTLQEAYDYARRILYAAEKRSCPNAPAADDSVINSSGLLLTESRLSCSSTCQAVKQLSDIHDRLACHICIDADINVAFVPCGHIVCCAACAKRLDCCPLCKCSIDLAQPVFLPYTRPAFTVANDNMVMCK